MQPTTTEDYYADQLNAEITRLSDLLVAEREARTIDQCHAVHDYELLRCGMLQVLKRNIDLLDDGLHALRHGRTHVTDEFIDRTLDAMRKQQTELRRLADRGE